MNTRQYQAGGAERRTPATAITAGAAGATRISCKTFTTNGKPEKITTVRKTEKRASDLEPKCDTSIAAFQRELYAMWSLSSQ